jgi:hypothetical protein
MDFPWLSHGFPMAFQVCPGHHALFTRHGGMVNRPSCSAQFQRKSPSPHVNPVPTCPAGSGPLPLTWAQELRTQVRAHEESYSACSQILYLGPVKLRNVKDRSANPQVNSCFQESYSPVLGESGWGFPRKSSTRILGPIPQHLLFAFFAHPHLVYH